MPHITFRITDEEKAVIQERAESLKLSVSDYCKKRTLPQNPIASIKDPARADLSSKTKSTSGTNSPDISDKLAKVQKVSVAVVVCKACGSQWMKGQRPIHYRGCSKSS